MERVMLTPLTPEEQQFAADNYDCLQRCIRSQRLDQDMTDVAALGYVHAVKKWFARPDLHKWPFRSIAYQTIRCHVSNERCKQGRRIQAVSLDAEVPGTDGFTYGQIITAEHMNYLKGESVSMEIKYDEKIPEAARHGRCSVAVETLLDFLESGHKTLALSFKTRDEAASKCGSLRSWKKKNAGKYSFEVYRLDTTVYVEKGKGKNG